MNTPQGLKGTHTELFCLQFPMSAGWKKHATADAQKACCHTSFPKEAKVEQASGLLTFTAYSDSCTHMPEAPGLWRAGRSL